MTLRLRSGQARAGLVIVAIVILSAIGAPWLLPWDPATQDLPNRLQGPTWHHWFGLDELGRDILARVLLGARVSLWSG
jgi:ABC-type dipeptide/oligopeptide/nickel transport system permease subunit